MIKKFEQYTDEYLVKDFDWVLSKLKESGFGDHAMYRQKDFEESSYYNDEMESDQDYLDAFYKFLEDEQMGQSQDDDYCDECGEEISDDPNVSRQCECTCDNCDELIRYCECGNTVLRESRILKFNESTDVDSDKVKDIIEEIITMSEDISNQSNKLKAFKKKLSEHTDSENIDENDQLDDAIVEIDSTTSKLDDAVTQLDNVNVSLKDYIEKGKQYLY